MLNNAGYLTPRTNPYVRALLQNARSANNGTTAGGLASVLGNLGAGMMQSQDRMAAEKDKADQLAAQKAFMQGMTPTGNPNMGPGQVPGSLSRVAQLLSGMGDNPHAGQMMQQVAMMQAQQQMEEQRAEQARLQKLADAKDLYRFEQENKADQPGPDSAPIKNYAKRVELVNQYGEGSPQVRTFDNYVRSLPYLNTGAAFVQPGIAGSPTPSNQVGVGLAPERTINDGQIVTMPPVPGGAIADGYNIGDTGLGGIGEQMPDGVSTTPLPQSPESLKKEEGRQEQVARAGGTVIQDLQRALDIIENDWSSVSAATAPVMKHIPLTDAQAASGMIESALSNVGLDTLQQMRENSPTGGALGQVPIQQQKRLEQVLGSLDLSQRPEIVKDNIKRVINIYKDIVYGSPDEIRGLADAGRISPEIAAQAAERYPLSFNEMGKSSDAAPEGIDPEDWKYMTPEERALFK